MKSIIRIAVISAAIATSAQCIAQTETKQYHFEKKIDLPGDGKWDYLKMDSDKKRLFVSHFDRVHVIDLSTDKPVGEISGLHGAHGIALVKEQNKGYISNGLSNTVTVFDYNTLKVMTTIPLSGKKPDCIIYDKASDKVLVFCGETDNVAVIDVHTDKVTSMLALGGAPEFAVADGKGMVYNNLEDKNEVVAINTLEMKVVKRFPLKTGVAPTGIAMDKENNRLFVVCNDSKNILILDAANGKKISELPIGGKVDAVTYDKTLKMIVTSNGEGNATVIKQLSADDYKLVQIITTKPGMKTLTHNGETHKLYISGAYLKEKQIQPGSFGVSVYSY